jgi:hypothetical protein
MDEVREFDCGRRANLRQESHVSPAHAAPKVIFSDL